MWAIGFWLDGFLPLWVENLSPDRIRFDVAINASPGWSFIKGTLVSYVRTVTYWRYTTVKR